MKPFEGSFLLLDRLARTTEGLSRKDDWFDDLVIGYDDTAYSSSPNLQEVAGIYTGNPADSDEPGIIGIANFSGTGSAYSPQPFIVDVVGASSTSAYTLPASTVAVAGDLEVIAIYGGFTGTIAACPAGYYDLGGNAQSTLCSVRLCYKVLTGPSAAISLSDLGEANGAVRFVIRGATSIGGYELDAGLFSSYTDKTMSDSTSPRVCLFFVVKYSSLSSYSDYFSSTTHTLPAYSSGLFTGGYNLALRYSTYSGAYISSSIALRIHEGNYDSAAYCYVCAINSSTPPEKDTVLVASEAPDVAAVVLENVVSPLDVALSASEAPDVASFSVTIPKAAFADALFSLASSVASTGRKGASRTAALNASSSLDAGPKKGALGQLDLAHSSSLVAAGISGFFGAFDTSLASTVTESHLVLYGSDRSGYAEIEHGSSFVCLASKGGVASFSTSAATDTTSIFVKGVLVGAAIEESTGDLAAGSKNSVVSAAESFSAYLAAVQSKSASQPAAIQGTESVATNYAVGVSRSIGIFCLSETAASCSKKVKAGSSIIAVAQVDPVVSKSRFVGFLEKHNSSVVASYSPAKTCVFLLNQAEAVQTGHFKSLFGILDIPCVHSLNSGARVVTQFEYGDLVIVDLRATRPEIEQTCMKAAVVVDVRRGEGLDFSCARGLSLRDVRRKALDVFCAGPRILGTEIVCVREVFNEGE